MLVPPPAISEYTPFFRQLFYCEACFRRRYVMGHPDRQWADGWSGVIMKIDRCVIIEHLMIVPYTALP